MWPVWQKDTKDGVSGLNMPDIIGTNASNFIPIGPIKSIKTKFQRSKNCISEKANIKIAYTVLTKATPQKVVQIMVKTL